LIFYKEIPMDITHTAESRSTDNLLNDKLVPPTEASPNREAAFRQHLDRYEDSAASADDALAAALTFVVSDLLDMACLIASQVKQSVRRADDKLKQLDRLQPHTEQLLKIDRQADRFINVGVRNKELRLKAEALSESRRARHSLRTAQRQGQQLQSASHRQ
jgi:hypothetical protein